MKISFCPQHEVKERPHLKIQILQPRAWSEVKAIIWLFPTPGLGVLGFKNTTGSFRLQPSLEDMLCRSLFYGFIADKEREKMSRSDSTTWVA